MEALIIMAWLRTCVWPAKITAQGCRNNCKLKTISRRCVNRRHGATRPEKMMENLSGKT